MNIHLHRAYIRGGMGRINIDLPSQTGNNRARSSAITSLESSLCGGRVGEASGPEFHNLTFAVFSALMKSERTRGFLGDTSIGHIKENGIPKCYPSRPNWSENHARRLTAIPRANSLGINHLRTKTDIDSKVSESTCRCILGI